MTLRIVLLLALAIAVRPASAQLADAEAAFVRGDLRAARAGYETVLQADSLNPRAIYRLAVLDSWDGQLQRSLDRFEKLRRLEPTDADIMVAQAQVFAWAGRYARAEALYDTVLDASPAREDAMAGRARAVAWRGDLDRAERLWRDALGAHPDDAEILTGLAQTLLWEGHSELADSYATRARQLAPTDKTAGDVLSLARAARRPEISSSATYGHDSDRNGLIVHDGAIVTSLAGDLRATLRAGWRRASDVTTTRLSYGAAGVVVAPVGHGAVAHAGIGLRRLERAHLSARTPLTAQAGVGFRPASFASVSLSYAREPMDETVVLIDSAYVTDALDLSFDVAPSSRVSLSGGAGVSRISDAARNRRTSALVATMITLGRGVSVGGLARTFAYRVPNPGAGYFAPDRFTLAEGRLVYGWRRDRWGVRMDGGLGTQQVASGGASQSEWHAALAATRGWSANSEVALTSTLTNSAASRSGAGATPGYKYWSLGLSLRQGL